MVQRDQQRLWNAGTRVQSPAPGSGLRACCCHGCGAGCDCGLDLIPGLGTPYAMGQPEKKKAKKKKKKDSGSVLSKKRTLFLFTYTILLSKKQHQVSLRTGEPGQEENTSEAGTVSCDPLLDVNESHWFPASSCCVISSVTSTRVSAPLLQLMCRADGEHGKVEVSKQFNDLTVLYVIRKIPKVTTGVFKRSHFTA